MLAGFTTEGLILIVVMVAAVSLIVQMAYRRLFPDQSIAGSQLQTQILQLQRDLTNLAQGHLALRDDFDQLRQLVVNIGLSPAAPRTNWSTFDAQLQSLKRAVEDLAGHPLASPPDARPTQWERVSEDDEPSPGVG